MSDQELLPAVKQSTAVSGFTSAEGFELIQRQAKVLAASDLVPKEFKGNIANCIIGLEIAGRIGASPLSVLQNLYIVHGKPSWSSQFIIAAVNSTGKFSPLRFDMTGEPANRTCTAWATDLATGDRLESPQVSMAMAKAEQWIDKAGSKWKTMPELMLRYRAATFFGRLYAPEILMGMQTMEEVIDITPTTVSERTGRAAVAISRINAAKEMGEVVDTATGEIIDPIICDLCGKADGTHETGCTEYQE
jgi:hypothetical protein